MKKKILGLLAILLVLGGCSSADPETGKDDTGDETVLFTMTLKENDNWMIPEAIAGGWDRYSYHYKDPNNSFDLSSMFENEKVYVFTYSFKSDIDIDSFWAYFWGENNEKGWNFISENNHLYIVNLVKNTKYSGRVVYYPDDSANGYAPNEITLTFGANNRNVSTSPTLSFYEFKLEPMDKENGLDTWTISSKDFTIDKAVSAKEEANFSGKSNVLHIKPAYNATSYGDSLIFYDLDSYAGQTIVISMSMDIYLMKAARIAWQIDSNPEPYYPVVCGVVAPDSDSEHHPELISGSAYSANTWHSIEGTYPYTVPTTGSNGKQLYLSGMQIEGAEAYFANAAITITPQ
jgi:hypothetical protein